MSTSPNNLTPSSGPGGSRRGIWSGFLLLALGLVLGSGSMLFWQRSAEPLAPVTAANPAAADDPFLPATPVQGSRGSDPIDPDDPFAALDQPQPVAEPQGPDPTDAPQSASAEMIGSEAPMPVEDPQSSPLITVNPLDDEATATARLEHAAETVEELRRLTEAQRAAQAELAAELSAHLDDPPSGLFDQLDIEEQLLASQLAGTERLADRIQVHENWITRLQKHGEQLAAAAKAQDCDRLAVRAFEAQAQLALAKEQHRGERTPAEISILAEEVRDLNKVHQAVHALYLIGARGGEAERWDQTGYYLCRARADLELASGNRAAALVELHKACEFVDQEVRNSMICISECFDLSNNISNAVARRTAAFTRLYDHARLLGNEPQIEWVRKHGP